MAWPRSWPPPPSGLRRQILEHDHVAFAVSMRAAPGPALGRSNAAAHHTNRCTRFSSLHHAGRRAVFPVLLVATAAAATSAAGAGAGTAAAKNRAATA